MKDLYLAIVPVLLTGLLGFVVYRYRNRIAYSVTSMGTFVPDSVEEITINGHGQLSAERITVKNFGYRALDNVELHWELANRPFSIEISRPSTLSKSAIKTVWEDRTLKIIIPSFPSYEDFKVDVFYVGYSGLGRDKLRGTGGRYKIVDLERYEIIRSVRREVIWTIALFFVLVILGPLISNLTQPLAKAAAAPSPQVGGTPTNKD